MEDLSCSGTTMCTATQSMYVVKTDQSFRMTFSRAVFANAFQSRTLASVIAVSSQRFLLCAANSRVADGCGWWSLWARQVLSIKRCYCLWRAHFAAGWTAGSWLQEGFFYLCFLPKHRLADRALQSLPCSQRQTDLKKQCCQRTDPAWLQRCLCFLLGSKKPEDTVVPVVY